jgi:hypothetical protein
VIKNQTLKLENVPKILPIDLEANAQPKLDELKSWGKQGGLCELRGKAPDRQPLENLFFNREELPENAHMHRRDSLLLFLNLTNIFTNHASILLPRSFGVIFLPPRTNWGFNLAVIWGSTVIWGSKLE